MPTITCPDCSGVVSPRAAACPHCGRPRGYGTRTIAPEPRTHGSLASDDALRRAAGVARWVAAGLLFTGGYFFLAAVGAPSAATFAEQIRWCTRALAGAALFGVPGIAIGLALRFGAAPRRRA